MHKSAVAVAAVVLSLFTVHSGGNASPQEYAVRVSASVQESPPRIDFSWPADSTAGCYVVFRKHSSDTAWGDPVATLDGSADSFSDSDISVGEAFEYSFRKSPSTIVDTVHSTAGRQLTFTIFDAWGDGMCCHHGLGSYEVSDADTLYASGGNFGNGAAHSFLANRDELIVSLVLDAFPLETTWRIIDDISGDTLAVGGPYEPPRYGHIFAGIRYPAIEDRGAMLLIVEADLIDSLSEELNRLELDIIADGFRVFRHAVDSGATVPEVKTLIAGECSADPTMESILLVGHVPVPYSGNVWSAHPDHHGAWPADLYYGELDGEWTDVTVNNTTASRDANHNVPGDGKFDQTILPSDVDLKVGRVDLSRLGTFAQSECELMRRYLDKNHRFRRGELTAERRGLITDAVGDAMGLAFAANGWRNFAVMFSADSTRKSSYLNTLENKSYLWSYGCGPGGYTGIGAVATTADFATRTVQTVFTMLYSSYSGDWDIANNVLRAALAAESHPLATFWAGRPAWHLHHMALGHTLGYSTRLSQNNSYLYAASDGARQIHTALLGDPTLKMHIVKPAGDLHVDRTEGGTVQLSWRRSEEPVEGYHIYRAPDIHGVFTRVNAAVVVDSFAVDPDPPVDKTAYMVRAVKLEQSGSGTYYNLSAGIIDSVGTATALPGQVLPARLHLAPCYPNPFNPETAIRFDLPGKSPVRLAVYDIRGRTVRLLHDGTLPAGSHLYRWNGRDDRGQLVPSGVYFTRLEAGDQCRENKMILIR